MQLDRRFLRIIEILMEKNEEEFCRTHVISRIDDENCRIQVLILAIFTSETLINKKQGYLLCNDDEKALLLLKNVKDPLSLPVISQDLLSKVKNQALLKILKR